MADDTTILKLDDFNNMLKIPIETECFMVATTWWNQFMEFISGGFKHASEPGIIYNLELVYDQNH